tara:strand:- start:13581 stop:13988 length:408 start_codon:yes stop_codon:yes gene_type:complete
MPKSFENVYFIDDDPIYVFISKKLIVEENFCKNIRVFENGKNAIEAIVDNGTAKQQLPNIIFLDLTMPVMNGWEFLESFQASPIENKETIKIIVMSSSINPLEIDMIKSYAIVSEYIVKPITPADLAKIIKTYHS